ncbi:hypothetical protein BGW80DRAFT_156986 [Lactifluus volemus]|nr:hypothetical protein BGW80DRAFT_156986 [Lactifluus volemus]
MAGTIAVYTFGVAYFQVPWAIKHGALQTLGYEAAVVAGLFVLIVPMVQLMGRVLRVRARILCLIDQSTCFPRNAFHVRGGIRWVHLSLRLFSFLIRRLLWDGLVVCVYKTYSTIPWIRGT